MKIQHEREYIYHKISSSSTPIVEKISYIYKDNEVRFDSNNNNLPLYIEAFTARTLSSRTDEDKVFFRGFDSTNSISGSWFWSDNIFYKIQNMFFPDDAFDRNNYITNPWTGESVSSLHCITFSNHLFNDQLDSLNSDIVISITGNLEATNFIGYGSYDSSDFIYTDFEETFSNLSFSKSSDALKIPKLDELNINYTYVVGRIYHDGLNYYKLSGVLLKDYGLIILFNNFDNWPDFESARLINKDDVNFGSVANPAVWWKIMNNYVKYDYVKYFHDYKLSINIPWDKCNYSSNNTLRNSSGAYKFTHINDLNDLSIINKTNHPKTYISLIYLMNDYNEVMAICKFKNPIKKDFLNEYDFNIRIRI